MSRRARNAIAAAPVEEKPIEELLADLERLTAEAQHHTAELITMLRETLCAANEGTQRLDTVERALDTAPTPEPAASRPREQLSLFGSVPATSIAPPAAPSAPVKSAARVAAPIAAPIAPVPPAMSITRLGDDVLRVLSACDVDGNAVRLPGERLDRKLYTRVNDALEALGGKWNRKAKAHLFDDDPAASLDAAITTGQVMGHRDADKLLGFFPTPAAVVADLIARADVRRDHLVLEPSAGDGAIARALRIAGARVACCEIDPGRCDALDRDGFVVMRDDFLRIGAAPSFDRVVMNPPFARGADVAHVAHALKHLVPGGRLVSVMSGGVEFREDRRTREFRDLVARCNGSITRLPPGSFRESGTDVNTVVVVMEALHE